MPESRELFEELQRLFRRGSGDPVRRFLLAIKSRDRRGNTRDTRVSLAFGDAVEDELELLPVREPRRFSGPELTRAIIRRYNEDYWLLAFWNALTHNAKESQLGLELVRGLVKHGVFLTGEELIAHKREKINAAFVTENGLRNPVDYYKSLFNWSDILGCLHLTARKEIVRRLRRDPSIRRLARLRELPREHAVEHLPEINDVLGHAKLPPLKRDAKEHTANINTITSTIFINAHFWRNQRQLRESLADVIGLNRPFSRLH